VIAALGGVAFLSEQITVRLLISSVVILGGIGLSVSARAASKIFTRIGGPSAPKPLSSKAPTAVRVDVRTP
jgi:hypothetical protein